MERLERALEEGTLSSLDRHFALAIARICGETRPEVILSAALASQRVAQGHVGLDLASLVAAGVDSEACGHGAGLAGAPLWPKLEVAREALCSSPLVAAVTTSQTEDTQPSAAGTPLVLDEQGLLYLRRYWHYQQRLAADLLRRVALPQHNLDSVLLEAGLDRLFGPDASDEQRRAAACALQTRFCVISGGPGTGKTTTVVKIMALLVEQRLARGESPPIIELVAPTGKAAVRLKESIARQRASLACDDAVRAALPVRARTVHRCLGVTRSRGFRHDAAHPLRCDVLILDEASMVDLALMARLSLALPRSARWILLGDRDQLASVEAGSVLGDLCAAAEAGGGLEGCAARLTRSRRYTQSSGIGALAAAIKRGDAEAAIALLESEREPALSLHLPDSSANWPASALEPEAREGWSAFLSATDPAQRLQAFGRFRVLCAHRRGRAGAMAQNRRIERWLAESGAITLSGQFYAGRPLLVTRNDAGLDLFNGDVGLVADASADPDGRVGARLLALFPGADGRLRWIAPLRLPPVETAFAMSVHKSQGSEFDSLALVLPETPSPVLSRELIYTAVSRARERVSIFGSREVLRAAIGRRVERVSGLRGALSRGASAQGAPAE